VSFVPQPLPLAYHINLTENPDGCVDHEGAFEFKATLIDNLYKVLVPKPMVIG